MRFINIISIVILLNSCSFKKDILYLNGLKTNNKEWPTYYHIDSSSFLNFIQIGDILKIDVTSVIPEASLPYNLVNKSNTVVQNIELVKLSGYLIDEDETIDFPVLGEITTKGLTISQLEKKIKQLLIEGGHLTKPSIKIRRVNSKFTVLGEVKNPGTFNYYDKKLTIFQALGYAGDLTILAKRKKIKLIREKNSTLTIHKFSLTDADLLQKKYYYIGNNDVIIVEPNYNKIKSAGFIGSPSSISSIASILLSITLLITNN